MRSTIGQAMNKPEILTSRQKELMHFLFSDTWFRRYFYLTGGTALSAFYLHHRYSEDLDFFANDVELTSIPKLFKDAAKKLGCPVQQVQTSPGFMRFRFDELKVDVVTDIPFRVGVPELIDDYMVDNLKNITVNKVGCILGRLDAKDYIDLYFLLTENDFDIFELISLGQNKDAGLEPFIWASLIADVEKLVVMPRMIKPIDKQELVRFFLDLRDEILDKINPKRKK